MLENELKTLGIVLSILTLSSCSMEKEYPLPCVEDGKQATKELCLEYRKSNLDEVGKSDVLRSYGFNERDAQFIISETTKGRVRCRVVVTKQCDLIALRNGVGY